MRLGKYAMPFVFTAAFVLFSPKEAHGQFKEFRDYNGCISISYKGSSGAEYYKAFISKVPSGERMEAARQPADMKTFEFYGLEVGAPYNIEISGCRQGPEGEVCDPPDVFRGIAKLPK
jgi:hypothetical protein